MRPAGSADVDLGHGDGATRAGDAQPVAHPDLTRPQPQPGPAAARVPVDREDGAGHGVVAAAAELRQKITQHVAQQRDAHARECRPAEQRREEALPRAAAQRRTDAAHRERAVVDPSREHALVDLRDCLDDGLVVRRDRFDVGVPSALAHRAGELDDVRRQPAADLRDDGCDVGAGAVDLVDEQRGRDADAPQGAPDNDGLRLHALDRRQHQHRGVENGQRSLHLGDEVGVTGRVHEVHGQVVDVEGRDRGADGDAAPALEVHRVGAGRAGVDAAGCVDDARVEEQAFGQAGLTGVDVRDDPQVQVRTGGQEAAPREDGRGSGAW